MFKKLKPILIRNRKIRKLSYSVEKNRLVYLLVCLVISQKMRSICWNYLFKREEMLNKLLSHLPLPRNLYIEGTNICNANCIFCAYKKMKRPKTTMDIELFKDVIDQYVDMNGKAIGLTPIVGDPLLDKFLFNRLDYVDQKTRIKNVGFYTNGIALSKDKVDRLLEYKNTIINCSISFGGFDRYTFLKIMGVDRFDIVKDNILYLLAQLGKKFNPNIIIKVDYRCPDGNDTDYLFKRLKECIKAELIKHDSLKSVFDSFGGLIGEEILAPAGLNLNFYKPKMGPCDIFFRKPLILADGKVNACAERDLETSLIIGDVTKEPLREILRGNKLSTLIKRFYGNDIPKVCDECTVYQSIYDRHSKIWKNNLNWAVE